MFTFTAAQASAVHGIRVSQSVMAGAGAGKTRVLVERYLNLLKASDRPLNSVVAVTFTEKAAAEMRSRVRDRLERERLDPALDAATRARCEALLRQIDSARINTIHALCAEILRASAAELGIDPEFVILDEVEAAILLQGAIDDALRAGIETGALGRLVALGFTPDEIRAVLRNHGCSDPPPALTALGLPLTPDQRVAAWLREWTAEARPQIDAILTGTDFQFCCEYAPPASLPDKIATAFQTITPTLAALRATDDPAACYALFTACVALPKPGNLGGKALADAREVIRLLRTWGEDLASTVGPPPGPVDRRAAEAEPDWLALIRACAAAYRAAKAGRAALDFDDLERLAHDLLTTQPAARDRWRDEIAALLVDEFQDTNPIQWAIIRALADPAQPGRLFLVGDAKQSIYAFRGADVAVFARATAEIEAAGGERLAFRDSFRAHLPLVTGFNALFRRILQPQADPPQPFETAFSDAIDAMIAHTPTAPTDDPPLETLLVPHGGDEAAAVARRIRELVGTALVRAEGTIRPAGYGDIAVLLPALTESVTTRFEGAFRAAGIPFVTVAGRGYFARQEVADVMRLLRALESPADDLALATALRSPLFTLSDDALLALRLLTGPDGRPLPLWEALTRADAQPLKTMSSIPEDERAAVAFAAHTLPLLRSLAGRAPIAELIQTALDLTGYPAALESLPRDGARRRGNLDKLVDIARASGHVRLNAFNRYAEALTTSDVREGEAVLDAEGVVRIMTIHKSKGLEFPIVFVANAHRAPRDESPPALIDPALGFACTGRDDDGEPGQPVAYRRVLAARQQREQAERRRLLYVGMTRAADRCLVSGTVSGINKDKYEPEAKGMFGWLLDAVRGDGTLPDPGPDGAHDLKFDGWMVRLSRADDAPAAASTSRAASADPWDVPAWDGVIPGLLAPLTLPPTAAARALPVTLAADLGAIAHVDPIRQQQHINQARRRLLHAAPERIQRATPEPLRVDPTPRLVGDLVHRALRWCERWSGGDEGRLSTLDHYAWEQGITDDDLRARVVEQAAALLARELAGDVQTWIGAARRVLRETPFVCQRGEYQFQGIIDVLIERADGTWALIDYKTASVSAPGRPDQIRAHARRYHLQVGIYAAAARDLLGLDAIDVYLRYIRYSHTIAVTPDEWTTELSALETRIETVMRTTP